MSVNLQKGQRVSLSKDREGLSKIMVGLGWDAAEVKKHGLFGFGGGSTHNIDCDASVILLKNGRLESSKDVVYFGNLKHASGAVKHMGDNLTGDGDGDDEQIMIDLSKLPPEYDRLVIALNIYQAAQRHQHFGMIKNAFCRLVDERRHEEMCRYNLTDSYPNQTAMIFGEIYREGSEWKFNAIGQGTKDNSINTLANHIY